MIYFDIIGTLGRHKIHVSTLIKNPLNIFSFVARDMHNTAANPLQL